MIKILIIDKEIDVIHRLLTDWNEYAYECKFALTINDGVEKFLSFCPDIILTEYNLPNVSVQNLTKRIRKLTDIPIVVFSSRTDETAVINSFQYGADDFIKKPGCTSKELFLRIMTILNKFRNRSLLPRNDSSLQDSIQLHDIVINIKTYEVKKANRLIFLSSTEYKLLLLMAKQKNHIVSTTTIAMQLFPDKDEVKLKRNLYTYFSNIRKKLSLNTMMPVQIKCISNEGYCLIVN